MAVGQHLCQAKNICCLLQICGMIFYAMVNTLNLIYQNISG